MPAQAKTTIQKATETQVAKKTATPQQTMLGYVHKLDTEITKALPPAISKERFLRIIATALSTNDKLAECNPKSFLASMMESAQCGLEPNTALGQAYLIPFKDKCTFVIGYKGLLELARRSNDISVRPPQIVYENDEFSYEFGLYPDLIHKPAKGDRGAMRYVYATYIDKNDCVSFEVMSVEDIEKHAKKFSKTFTSGPWQTDFEAMAKKTVLKQLLKYAPLSIEAQRVIASDGTYKTEIAEDMTLVEGTYVDVEVDETE